MSFSVAGKNAIVTGAASGINLAFAKLLVSKGARRVLIADIQQTDDVTELLRFNGSNYYFHKTDVGNFVDLAELFAYAKMTMGSIDLLCNGAGVYEPPWSNFWTDTESTSYKSIDINLSGLMRGTRLAIRDQITRGKKTATESNEVVGVILNVSSVVAQLSHFNQPLYCASKAGVSSFTRLLAMLQPEFGIKVVAVAPGVVDTPLWRADPDKLKILGGEDVLITVDELAAKMLLVVESEKYPGGTVLEVLKESTRIVYADSSLPTGPGSTASHMESVTKDTINLLREEQKAGAKSTSGN